MGNRQFSDTWLGKRQLFKLLFVSIPKTRKSEPRWAIFQVILSFFFLFVATAIALLTVDFQKIRGDIVIAALVLVFFAVMFLMYAIGTGIHWYKSDSVASSKDDEQLPQQSSPVISIQLQLSQEQTNAIVNAIKQAGSKQDE